MNDINQLITSVLQGVIFILLTATKLYAFYATYKNKMQKARDLLHRVQLLTNHQLPKTTGLRP